MLGKTIGNYQITSELAHGGMGAVYRGRHLTLPREVVVKSILLSAFPPHAQEHLKARFLREATIQSQLDHPGIVRVLEFFTASENYYLVMEYVAGMNLRDLLERQGALAPEQAAQLFKQALAAMDYAHNFSYVDESGQQRTGIIHRDIKPANMLLDGRARLKLTDFGIVKMIGERGMTQTGFNPGTVEYMSPEQLRGYELDVRSDIYSLGVTFYEMLAGRLPFPPSDTGSDYEVRKGHIEMEPPPITSLRPEVPAELATIVMRSLRKNPAERFQTMAEFLDAILYYERRADTADQVAPNPVAGVTEAASAAPTLVDQQVPKTSVTTLPRAAKSPAAALAVAPVRSKTVIPEPRSPYKAQPPPPRRSLPLASVAVVLLILAAASAFFLTRKGPQPPEASSNLPAAAQTNTASSQNGAPSAASNNPSIAAQTATKMSEPQPARPTSGAAGDTAPNQTREAQTAAPAAEPPPAKPTGEAPGSATLNQARESERQERYREAIALYDTYLSSYPGATDAAVVAEHMSRLKKFQGLVAIAETELRQQDYRAAAQDYRAALELRPESRLAKAGFEEAEAALARNSDSGERHPPIRRPDGPGPDGPRPNGPLPGRPFPPPPGPPPRRP